MARQPAKPAAQPAAKPAARGSRAAEAPSVSALDGAHVASTPSDIPMASDVGAQGLSILSDIANRQSLTFTPDRALGIEIVQMQTTGQLLGAGMQRPWDWSAGASPPREVPAAKPAKATPDHGRAKPKP